MTDAFQAATTADAQFVHDEWDRRTRAHDIDGLPDDLLGCLDAPEASAWVAGAYTPI
jgi:hypothetical protein